MNLLHKLWPLLFPCWLMHFSCHMPIVEGLFFPWCVHVILINIKATYKYSFGKDRPEVLLNAYDRGAHSARSYQPRSKIFIWWRASPSLICPSATESQYLNLSALPDPAAVPLQLPTSSCQPEPLTGHTPSSPNNLGALTLQLPALFRGAPWAGERRMHEHHPPCFHEQWGLFACCGLPLPGVWPAVISSCSGTSGVRKWQQAGGAGKLYADDKMSLGCSLLWSQSIRTAKRRHHSGRLALEGGSFVDCFYLCVQLAWSLC